MERQPDRKRPDKVPRLSSLLLLSSFLAFFSMLFGCAAEHEPQTQEPPAPEVQAEVRDPIASGKATYEASCMSCHGTEARGDGPVAELLTIPPADLTQLRKKQGGLFPVDEVYRIIDGREEYRAHGTREMPVWGNIWSDAEGQPIAEEKVERRINELVEYLRSIQEETR